jgi:hypothetical protein
VTDTSSLAGGEELCGLTRLDHQMAWRDPDSLVALSLDDSDYPEAGMRGQTTCHLTSLERLENLVSLASLLLRRRLLTCAVGLQTATSNVHGLVAYGAYTVRNGIRHAEGRE